MEERHRISNAKFGLMVSVALFIDAMQILFLLFGLFPPLAIFSTLFSSFTVFIAFLSFLLWYQLSDIHFFENARAIKRMFVFFSAFFVELLPLPFVDFITDGPPLITIGVVLTCLLVRRDDREYNKKLREQMRQAQEEQAALEEQEMLMAV